MGREYAAQVEQQLPIIRNPELSGFVERIGRRLAAAPDAGDFPYTFKVVQDKSINAFALPGGPTFTHTGLMRPPKTKRRLRACWRTRLRTWRCGTAPTRRPSSN